MPIDAWVRSPCSYRENAVDTRSSTGKPRKSIFPQSPLRIPRPKPSLFHLKRGSEDHSYGRPQNLADAPWLENRSITILMLSRGASSAFQYHLPNIFFFVMFRQRKTSSASKYCASTMLESLLDGSSSSLNSANPRIGRNCISENGVCICGSLDSLRAPPLLEFELCSSAAFGLLTK
jgi:hypothetical protein